MPPRPPDTRELFAAYVAKLTGLDRDVVLAWVLAEGGKSDNPLNIRRADGGFGGFGSWDKAAREVSRVLHQPRYANVLKAARTGGERAQIAAIVDSPWVGPEDPNKGAGYRRLLLGTLKRVHEGHWFDGIPDLPEVDNLAERAENAITQPIERAVASTQRFIKTWSPLVAAYGVLLVGSLILFGIGARQFVYGSDDLSGQALDRGVKRLVPSRTTYEDEIPF